MTSEESLSECSDSISSDNFSINKGSSSLDLMQTSSETVIFAGKAYLKINLLVKTLFTNPLEFHLKTQMLELCLTVYL